MLEELSYMTKVILLLLFKRNAMYLLLLLAAIGILDYTADSIK